MAKEVKSKLYISKELAAALKRFPKVVKEQEKRALEQMRFIKKTFGPLVKELKKDYKLSPIS